MIKAGALITFVSKKEDGGEGGIRTRGNLTTTSAFQTLLLGLCSTSP